MAPGAVSVTALPDTLPASPSVLPVPLTAIVTASVALTGPVTERLAASSNANTPPVTKPASVPTSLLSVSVALAPALPLSDVAVITPANCVMAPAAVSVTAVLALTEPLITKLAASSNANAPPAVKPASVPTSLLSVSVASAPALPLSNAAVIAPAVCVMAPGAVSVTALPDTLPASPSVLPVPLTAIVTVPVALTGPVTERLAASSNVNAPPATKPASVPTSLLSVSVASAPALPLSDVAVITPSDWVMAPGAVSVTEVPDTLPARTQRVAGAGQLQSSPRRWR